MLGTCDVVMLSAAKRLVAWVQVGLHPGYHPGGARGDLPGDGCTDEEHRQDVGAARALIDHHASTC